MLTGDGGGNEATDDDVGSNRRCLLNRISRDRRRRFRSNYTHRSIDLYPYHDGYGMRREKLLLSIHPNVVESAWFGFVSLA